MRILIAYSSGYGTTKEIAEEIGKIIGEGNILHVDILSIENVQTISEYDGIIIGSSVRANKALANVRDFIAAHRFEFPNKKLALFLVCLTANCIDGREKVKNEYFPQILNNYPQVHPISLEAFGGKIDFDKLNPVMQTLMRRVLEKTGLPTEGSIDTRDWTFIHSWAQELKNKLLVTMETKE